MVWQKGQSGNPSGLGPRPYRSALRIEAAAHENGGRLAKVRKGSLRYLARQALYRAGNNTAALEHVANRLDGPVIADKTEEKKEQIVEIRLVLIQGNESKVIEGEKANSDGAFPALPVSSEASSLDATSMQHELKNDDGSEA